MKPKANERAALQRAFPGGIVAPVLLRVSNRLRVREIRIHGERYIERYYLGTAFGVTAYLHRYLNCDGDRYLHDHPWAWSCGLPLVGGYTERRLRWLCPLAGPVDRLRTVHRFMPNIMTARSFHKIERVKPGTWTLFFHGRRNKGWAFLFPRQCDTQPKEHAIVYTQPLDTSEQLGWTQTAERGRSLRQRGVR